MANRRKVSAPTQVVLDTRALYLRRLQETVKEYGSPPYMQERVDSRTAGRQAAMTTPEDLMAMFQQNPMQAETLARRVDALSKRAAQNPPPFSAPGEFEVNE